MPNAFPHANINLQEVSTRNEHARHIVAGFASAMPTLTRHLAVPRRRAERCARTLSGDHPAFRRTAAHAA